MFKIYHLLAITALLSSAFADAEVEDNVIVLNDQNFDEEIKKYDYLLVEFYAPWCGHCKALAPEYAKAAKRLRENDPPYYIAKFDADSNKVVGGRYGVRGFPTLKFFKKGKVIDYNGGRKEDDIVAFVLKRTGPPSVRLACEELKARAEKSKFAVAFFGDVNSRDYSEIYLPLATDTQVQDKFDFFHVEGEECAKTYNTNPKNGFILFRKFEESPIVFQDSFNVAKLRTWMLDNSVPTLIEFNDEYSEAVQSQRKTSIILFRTIADAEKGFARVFAEEAVKQKGQGLLFVNLGPTGRSNSKFMEAVGLKESDFPALRIFDSGKRLKFKYEGNVKDMTASDLQQFISDYKANKLQSYQKSEDIPDNSGPLKVLVGKNFQQEVFDSGKDVLVKFYAPWCGHCKKLAPVWDKLAEELKDVQNLSIAKFDATANEFPGVDVRGYPTIKLYVAGDKKPIEFNGKERELQNFKDFLKEKSSAYKKHLESAASKSEL